MKLTRIPHLDGDQGVAQTIRAMRALVEQGKQDPTVHELAARILTRAHVPAFNFMGEARAIYDAVRRNLRFTRDVWGNETLHAAPDIIRLKIGDCDDFTILICSLLQTIGQECRIVTIATASPDLGASRSIPSEAPEFVHVYPEALLSGRWISLDCARKQPAFGKSPEHFTRKRAWSIDSEEYTDMAGFITSIAPGQGPKGAWRANVFPAFRRGMSGTYLSSFPAPPRSQRFRRPPVGFGTYGQAAARRMGLGDDTIDLTTEGSGSGNPDAGLINLPGATPTLPAPSAGGSTPGFNWNTLPGIVQQATVGTANIIAAERASPYNLFPTTSSALTASSPASAAALQAQLASGTFLGMPTSTLLLLALGVAAVIAAEGGRR
jgi:hypothetical protein